MAEKIYFGAGCFWCTEAVLKMVPGVVRVTPGYSGGHTKSPTYKEVCSGTTGHVEVAEVEYTPDKTDFSQLLDIFFSSHDPTTKDRQGADVGSQYRGAVYYTTEKQAKAVRDYIKKAQKGWKDSIVTEVEPLGKFYPAEDYHQDYFAKNPLQPYCLMVIRPKVNKIKNKLKN